jgi:AcrR family transcriptional regulator
MKAKANKSKQLPARRGRPMKGSVTQDAQQKILDAAEDHFSKHGFYGVTIREVATHAGVDTALLHYYFGSKQGLFDAVFRRRAEVMNAERLASINDYARRMGEAVTVEGTIEAFTKPVFEDEAKSSPEWRNYFALLAQVNNTPVWGGKTMARYFDPVIHRLIEVVRIALPEAKPEDLYWSYHFLSGALTLTLSQTGRIDRLSDGLCRSSDFRAIHARMVPFIAAGFRAVCQPAESASARPRKKRGANGQRTALREAS